MLHQLHRGAPKHSGEENKKPRVFKGIRFSWGVQSFISEFIETLACAHLTHTTFTGAHLSSMREEGWLGEPQGAARGPGVCWAEEDLQEGLQGQSAIAVWKEGGICSVDHVRLAA